MNERGERPDPDELLRRVQADERRSKRGKLRLFFGFAPGVGKTYRMLQVARDLVSERKVDLVVGVVETHRRSETAAMVLGLELLPRRKVDYRGRVLEELDLDAALARRPAIILVDELAHTNAPGSRHPKRWQDVDELLDAGIDVMSTMNVQHVESLNDVVAQITHVQVRETVPDAVVDRADSIELVDIAPEELLKRLHEGKVYLPDQARRATEHFFRRGNLLALRELALRRTAQVVDDGVQAYRLEHGVLATWPAGERLLVCVGAAPSSGRLIRAAARMAAGLRCPWVSVYVETPAIAKLGDADLERLEAHLRLAESLGGSVTRLSGVSIADALLTYARRHNVTRILLGKPTHSRLRDRLRGSLLDEVVRGSGDIDVHVISGDGAAAPPAARDDEAPSAFGAPPLHFAAAGALVAVTLVAGVLLRAAVDLPDPEMLFMLTVMATAIWFGRGPALLSATLGVACYDFFFVPPFLTFDIADRRYVLTFAMMFVVGFATSELASKLRRQQRDAVAREERTGELYALSRELASADLPQQIASVAARHAATIFGARVVVLHAVDGGGLSPIGSSQPDVQLDPKEQGVARWAYEHGELAGLGTDTLPGSSSTCAPLKAGARALGVLALVPENKAPLRAEQRALLDVVCRQVSLSLERARLADEARASALRAKTEEMRSSLLSTVSHDLRTPLASITGAATSLRDDDELSSETRAELVSSICDEAERLERLVSNLLDMTRLASGALSLRRDWVPLDELVGSALTRLEARLGAREVTVTLAGDLPLVSVDPVLFEQLLVNLLENACKYSPADAPIEIVARAVASAVELDVRDHGPGVPPGAEERVFEKFYRGPEARGVGAGLGLPICRGIAEAHGGAIKVENLPSGGALFRVTLPSSGPPPSASDEASSS